MENMCHMFGGTSKQSTLVDEAITRFPREDDGSPRQAILDQLCNAELTVFRTCMSANGFDENKCLESKNALDLVAANAFREVNSAGAGNWVF